MTINSKLLRDAMSKCSPVLSSNPVLPIIDGFLLTTDGASLTVAATDLQTDVQVSIPFTGSINCVAPKLLFDTLKALQGDISLELSDNTLVAKSATGAYRMPIMAASDYPSISEGTDYEYVGDVSAGIESVAWAASTDELRPIMQGVLWKQSESGIEFVATDAHRLPVFRLGANGTEKTMVIPAKAAKLLTGEISVSVSENKAHFQLPDKKVGVRLIDGKYPDYKAVIPTDNPFMAEADIEDVLAALKVVSIYASKNTHIVKALFSPDKLEIVAEDVDFGNQAVQTIPCKSSGEMVVGFNGKYLQEALRATKTFKLKGSAPNRPFIFEANDNFFTVLMPVQI
jgi:DNA polymerase III subunit beta